MPFVTPRHPATSDQMRSGSSTDEISADRYHLKTQHPTHAGKPLSLLSTSSAIKPTCQQDQLEGSDFWNDMYGLDVPTASIVKPQTLESFTSETHHVPAQLFSEDHHITSSALAMRTTLNEPALKVYSGSIMVHMEGFDQNQRSHVETMEKALKCLSEKFPKAGLILQLGSRFYRYKSSGLEEVPWNGATPPPLVVRMSAIKLPRHGRCVLVEGKHLHIRKPPSPVEEAADNLVAMRESAGPKIQLRAVEDQPLVLYCIQSNVLQAEKLHPMFSTPDGTKALFAAPVEPLRAQSTVTLRLRRGHAFSPDVTMTTAWLQDPVSEVNSQLSQLKLAAKTPSPTAFK